MTIKLAGLWELGWNTPIKEIDLWEYIAREFQVGQLVMAPVTGIASNVVTEVANLGDFLAAERAAGTTLVFFDETAPVDMEDFTHPSAQTNTCYVFGKASLSAWTAYGLPTDACVKISTPANLGGFWPHQAAALALYDRFRKSLV